jgi:hypothetical protein
MTADLIDVNPKIYGLHRARFPAEHSLYVTGLPPHGLFMQQVVRAFPMRPVLVRIG